MTITAPALDAPPVLHMPEALHALAAHLTNHPELPAPTALALHRDDRVEVQLHDVELRGLVRWASSLGVDTARVLRGGEPDADGRIRTGWVHLHVTGQLPSAGVPVEVWAPVPELDAGDLVCGSTVTDLGALLAPLAVVR